MADPFATGRRTLFAGPRAVAAVFVPAVGEPVPLRVVRSQPDATAPFGQGRVVEGTNMFQIPREAAAQDALPGAALTIGTEAFELAGEAMLDAEGLTWTIGGYPVP